ncbi:Ig-like domain-containing protein [Salimicrobium flavidum]|uniref:Ig-like domain-containing protein n=1 Tax=Salimicrobium flavidum TaxID=570947 RepID=A0A1N7J1S6_9BACI|nr:Ig-like domain-containing protein [Salimicrobium flavidum]SIS43171.1 Ig-like domain-containing protein [Salimicrobium flavidum]
MRYAAALIFFIIFLNGAPVFGEEERVPVDKRWTVEFSVDIDPVSVTEDTVYVTTENGEKVASVETKTEGRFVYVSNPSTYNYDTVYTLHVEKRVSSVQGEALLSGETEDFRTEHAPVQAPEGVTAEISYNHYGKPEVLVDWSPVPGADGYHFYYGDGEAMETFRNMDGTPETILPPFRDSFVYEGETWRYGAKSVKDGRESSLSEVQEITVPGDVSPGWVGESREFVEEMHQYRPTITEETEEVGLVYANGVFAGEMASFDYQFNEGKVTRTVIAFPDFSQYSEADQSRFFDYMTEELSGQFGDAAFIDESYSESGVRSAGWVAETSIRLVLNRSEDLTTAGVMISPVD